VSDVGFMMLGFLFTRYVPWWVAVLVIVALEVYVGYVIRDNLFLNIVMLLYPIDAIRTWQSG
jgi:hypothetical protein